jgi:Flp pilus assembly pilin Flp
MLRAWVDVEQRVRALRDREQGQGLVEYVLILGFVSVLLTAALGGLRNGVSNAFSNGVSAL